MKDENDVIAATLLKSECSDVSAAIVAGMQLSDIDPSRDRVALVPGNARIVDLEQFGEAPDRIRQNVKIRDAGDFTRYVNRFKNDETTVYANIEQTRFVAVIDHPGKETPTWGEHRATYECPLSRSWRVWRGKNGTGMAQAEFAKFIEDNLPDIVEPNASDILTISKTLEAKKSVDFQSSVRLDNGEVQITYNEEIRGTAGKGSLQVPDTFKLGIPVFEGGDHYELEARLRYRVNEGRLGMWFDLLRPERLLEDAFTQTLEKIKEELGEGTMILHADAP